MSKKILSFSALIFATLLFTLLCSNGEHNTLSLTTGEVHYLKALKKPIIAAPCPDYPPIDFAGSDGHFTGLTHDYLHEIGKKLGITFTLPIYHHGNMYYRLLKKKKWILYYPFRMCRKAFIFAFYKTLCKNSNDIVVRKLKLEISQFRI